MFFGGGGWGSGEDAQATLVNLVYLYLLRFSLLTVRKRVSLESSVAGSILICLKNNESEQKRNSRDPVEAHE